MLTWIQSTVEVKIDPRLILIQAHEISYLFCVIFNEYIYCRETESMSMLVIALFSAGYLCNTEKAIWSVKYLMRQQSNDYCFDL